MTQTPAQSQSLPEPPQPGPEFVVQALKEELDKVVENRYYLIASVKHIKAEAEQEINRLHGVIASVVSMVKDEENRDAIKAFLSPAAPEPEDQPV